MKKNNQPFSKKMAIYSSVASGALLLASPANAVIHYSGVQNLPVDAANPSQTIDFDGGGADFSITFTSWSYGPSSYGFNVDLNHLNGTAIGHIENPAVVDPALLNSGYSIQNTLLGPFFWDDENPDTLAGSYTGSNGTQGDFNNDQGYIGVRFNSGSGVRYGWIQFSNSGKDSIIIDWAYEDSGAPIQAGATGGGTPATSIPTLNQWGVMILIGLLAAAAAKASKKEENEVVA